MNAHVPVAYRLLLAMGLTLLGACSDSSFKGASARIKPTVTRTFTQDEYPVATTSHKQGHAGEPQNQKFEQGEWGMLDLLVVIDNSGSMIEEQKNLSTKLAPLLSQVGKANWQIAVVTTDASKALGCQRALIRKSDADYSLKFQDAINAGVDGSGLERPFYQAVSGLKSDCLGAKKWVRPGSTVSVLIVTDEDNCHIDAAGGYGCQGQSDLDSKYLTDYLSSIRTIGKDARVYGLLWHPQDTKPCSSALKQATKVAEAIQVTSGTWGSICDTDYTSTLTAISKDIAQIVKYEFDLAQEPDSGTLVITADGSPWTKFELSGKHVKFTEPPPFGAKMEVSYKFGASGDQQTEFFLDKVPVEGSVSVKVNGQVLDASAFKVDAVKKTVTLTEAPAERADVVFDYKEVAPLKSQFVIDSKTVDPASLVVKVNERAMAASGVQYDAATATVTLNPAPPAGAIVKVSYGG